MEVRRTEEEPRRRKSLFAGLLNTEMQDIALEVPPSSPTATAITRGNMQALETLRTSPMIDSQLEARSIDRRHSQPEKPYPPRCKVSALDIDAQKEYEDEQKWEEVRRGGCSGFLPSIKSVQRSSGRLVSQCLEGKASDRSWKRAASENSSRLSN